MNATPHRVLNLCIWAMRTERLLPREALTTIVNYYEQPGAKLAYIVDKTDDASGINCRYRTKDGDRCSVGVLIPDENYTEMMEGRGAKVVLGGWGMPEALGYDIAKPDEYVSYETLKSFLSDLQRAHDLAITFAVKSGGQPNAQAMSNLLSQHGDAWLMGQ